jgi:hypothetical protein
LGLKNLGGGRLDPLPPQAIRCIHILHEAEARAWLNATTSKGRRATAMNNSVYADLIRSHLEALFQGDTAVLTSYPGVAASQDGFEMIAFGQPCRISPAGIFLDGQAERGPRGIIVALLARHAAPDSVIETPWRAFRELPDSAPYVGAFRAHTEQILLPHVQALYRRQDAIAEAFRARPPEDDSPGDWSLIVAPLPKIVLCYHFYLPDEDFPANVTCLFANNAHRFLPTDALADVGEYMSRAMMSYLDSL